jgi:hypothetical protein
LARPGASAGMPRNRRQLHCVRRRARGTRRSLKAKRSLFAWCASSSSFIMTRRPLM